MKKLLCLKKLLCATLPGVILASSLTSCSAPTKNYSPKITVASSDAVSDAEWLTNRLGVLKDNVYLGVGSDEFDMTSFENDGYIIRSNDGEAVIVGKTAEGLTNGVRKYANYVDRKISDKLDISYHEGYRVEKFTLAGVDISEYAIEYPSAYNDNMLFAVGEFIQLTEKACGVLLTSSEGITDRRYAIEFRHSTDPELKENGYRYFFRGDRLIIEGAVARGCMYGVWRFFKNELDWKGLDYVDGRLNGQVYKSAHLPNMSAFSPDSVLCESEHIDVSPDTRREEVPAFNSLVFGMNYTLRQNDISRPRLYQLSYGPLGANSHGQSQRKWGGFDAKINQICYTDEDVFENVLTDVIAFVETGVESGAVIGETLKMIDLGQGDNRNYCVCNDCIKLQRSEGNAVSACIISFANRISEEMEAENPEYSKLIFGCFAYNGTGKPPKTIVPRDNVQVTFCVDHNCSAHTLDYECPSLAWTYQDDSIKMEGYYNQEMYEWLEGWSKITKHLYVWYYILDNHLDQYTVLDNLYTNVKLIQNFGVEGIYFETENNSLGMIWIAVEILCEMNWDTDMTRAEYDEYLLRILEKEFGDGWEYISEYIDIWQRSQEIDGNCWSCWYYDFEVHTGQYNFDYVAETFDYCTELLERALLMACDSREIRNCELFSVHMYYEGCFSSYFKEYDEGDSERLKVLADRYSLIYSRLVKNNIDVTKLGLTQAFVLPETIEEYAWNLWKDVRDVLPHGDTLRPAP